MSNENEDFGFWDFLAKGITSGELNTGDYDFSITDSITYKHYLDGEMISTTLSFGEKKTILKINLAQCISMFVRAGSHGVNLSLLTRKLKENIAFICENRKGTFRKIDRKSGMQLESNGLMIRTFTNAFLFDLQKLPLPMANVEPKTPSPKFVEITPENLRKAFYKACQQLSDTIPLINESTLEKASVSCKVSCNSILLNGRTFNVSVEISTL